LIRICRKEGLEDVVTYQSSGALMAALPGEQPECLIVDLHMPEMTGLQLKQRLMRSGVETDDFHHCLSRGKHAPVLQICRRRCFTRQAAAG
jgi:CheY-like chemotaxis protein